MRHCGDSSGKNRKVDWWPLYVTARLLLLWICAGPGADDMTWLISVHHVMSTLLCRLTWSCEDDVGALYSPAGLWKAEGPSSSCKGIDGIRWRRKFQRGFRCVSIWICTAARMDVRLAVATTGGRALEAPELYLVRTAVARERSRTRIGTQIGRTVQRGRLERGEKVAMPGRTGGSSRDSSPEVHIDSGLPEPEPGKRPPATVKSVSPVSPRALGASASRAGARRHVYTDDARLLRP